jgi:hypothetical protein
MSYSCHSIREQVDPQVVDESWRKCEEILAFMAIFSLSARNSLQFLQVTHQHIVQSYAGLWLSDILRILPVLILVQVLLGFVMRHRWFLLSCIREEINNRVNRICWHSLLS